MWYLSRTRTANTALYSRSVPKKLAGVHFPPSLCGWSMLSSSPIMSLSLLSSTPFQMRKLRAVVKGPRSWRESVVRNHHICQEKTSVTEWSMMIHPDPVLMLTFVLMLSISACPALYVHFPLSTNCITVDAHILLLVEQLNKHQK